MYAGKRIIAIIPARSGSKGIKNKNIVNLNGRPLIAYTIEAALRCRYIDKTVVTTDGLNIANIAKRYGAVIPFLRPKELALDNSKTIDAVLYTLKELENIGEIYDVLVLLQPTSPLRTSEDITGAIEKFFMEGEEGIASVSLVNDNPLLIREINDEGNMKRLIDENSTCRRQDMPQYYRINGAIYVNSIHLLDADTSFNDNPIGYVMEMTHSVDIDELKDIVLAEYYLAKEENTRCF